MYEYRAKINRVVDGDTRLNKKLQRSLDNPLAN
jgi:hypothetical protein